MGAIARYGLSTWAARHAERFPLGTLAVNVVGCFAIGALSLVAERSNLSETTRHFLAVGVLGSLTTFSTFGIETFSLLRTGSLVAAGTNVAANVGLGLVAVVAGRALARGLA